MASNLNGVMREFYGLTMSIAVLEEADKAQHPLLRNICHGYYFFDITKHMVLTTDSL